MKLWVLSLVATAVSAIISVLAISGLVELDSTRIDVASSALLLLSTPAWLEFVLFAAPTIALAGVVMLVRKRRGRAAGLISVCLALVAAACLVFIIAAGVQWGICSFGCILSNADVDALVRAPRAVEDLMLDASLISVAAILLDLALTASLLVMALRRSPAGEASAPDGVT